MESACRTAVIKLCMMVGEAFPSEIRPGVWGFTMRVPTRPLFKPFDYALMVAFAMAFVMLTTLRLA
jgi:hypothetical protein